MRRIAPRSLLLVLVAGLVAGTGCSTYYRVTDNQTGAVHYTTNWELHRYSNSDAVRFRDQNGELQTINNADVVEISDSEYGQGTGG